MTDATDILVAKELRELKQHAKELGWKIIVINSKEFAIRFKGSNGKFYWCKVCCDQYNLIPPAWHWYNPNTQELDKLGDIPKYKNEQFNFNYFHPQGFICAPWNRLAYTTHGGVHNNWDMTGWLANIESQPCSTLLTMAFQIDCELEISILEE